MAESRAEVRNAADKEQVKRAGRVERDRIERRLAVYASVLKTEDGREMVWDLLCQTGLFKSPYDASGSRVYFNIGRGDFGRELLAYLTEAHADSYLLMEREARTRATREDKERAAAYKPRAERTQTDDETDRDS